ncbi:MAG: esterase [Acidobacteria bacterium]|nr:MAG: esterase [Acidobacteriota bacterium]
MCCQVGGVEDFIPEGRFPMEPKTAADLRLMWPGTALETFGLSLTEADENRLVLEMPIRPEFRQPAGLLHGGLHLFLAESAASLHACLGIDLREQQPVGIEVNGSHLRAIREGGLVAEATVTRRSRTLIVHEVTIRSRERNRRTGSGFVDCSCSW